MVYMNMAARAEVQGYDKAQMSPPLTKLRLIVGAIIAATMAIAAAAGCALGSRRQSIDADMTHWIPYAFSDDAGSIGLKMPPGFRTLRENRLPQPSYDDRSQRLLLDAQYDFRPRSSDDVAELQIEVSMFRPSTLQSTSRLDVEAVARELRVADRRSMPDDADPKPGLDVVKGREWVHIDGTTGKFTANTFESYGTLLDGGTMIFVSAYYSAAIRMNQSWFESRRELLRAIRDQVVVRVP
jgi:hypothetical protein